MTVICMENIMMTIDKVITVICNNIYRYKNSETRNVSQNPDKIVIHLLDDHYSRWCPINIIRFSWEQCSPVNHNNPHMFTWWEQTPSHSSSHLHTHTYPHTNLNFIIFLTLPHAKSDYHHHFYFFFLSIIGGVW